MARLHLLVGCGRTAPDPAGAYVTSDGVEIPMGVGTDAGVDNSSLLYNEYPLLACSSKSILMIIDFLVGLMFCFVVSPDVTWQ